MSSMSISDTGAVIAAAVTCRWQRTVQPLIGMGLVKPCIFPPTSNAMLPKASAQSRNTYLETAYEL